LTTEWLKEGGDGTRYYQIRCNTYKRRPHAKQTFIGGAA
jgi:hypothetical protein